MEMKKELSLIGLPIALRMASEVVGIDFLEISALQDFFEKKQGWIELKDWMEMNDREIFSDLVRGNPPVNEMYGISDVSYRDDVGAFKFLGSEIDQFFGLYFEKFGECFFNGDVIFFVPKERRLWIFHHEGSIYEWAHQEGLQ